MFIEVFYDKITILHP